MRDGSLIAVLLVAGCQAAPLPADGHDSSTPQPDLTSQPDVSVPDLSIPDLAVPDLAVADLAVLDLAMPDLAISDLARGPDIAVLPDAWPNGCDGGVAFPTASGCAGTPLANTCVPAFFDPAIQCFAPSCNCTADYIGYMVLEYCWQNGARETIAGFGPPSGSIDWVRNGVSCLTQRPDPMGLPIAVFRRGANVLRVDDNQKIITCPNGTTLRGDYQAIEQCTGINALFGEDFNHPTRAHCTAGTCP